MSTRSCESFLRSALRCGVHPFTLVLCTAFLVAGPYVAARAELANSNEETVTVASPASIGEPLVEAISWDVDAEHGLFGHRMPDGTAAEPLLVAQRGAEQGITDLLDAALIATHRVADAGDRIMTLTSIAGVQAEAGDDDGAARSISEALSAARSIRREVVGGLIF